jgi:hypothetical protein
MPPGNPERFSAVESDLAHVPRFGDQPLEQRQLALALMRDLRV